LDTIIMLDAELSEGGLSVAELVEARMLDPNLFEATDWMIKLIFTEDKGSLRPAFTSWLDADPAHYAAFEHVKWIWSYLERGYDKADAELIRGESLAQ
jgi:ferric-dicitrate binding protein FerR (iron transport regulator)